MAFDGIVVAGLVHELKQKLTDGRIGRKSRSRKQMNCFLRSNPPVDNIGF